MGRIGVGSLRCLLGYLDISWGGLLQRKVQHLEEAFLEILDAILLATFDVKYLFPPLSL